MECTYARTPALERAYAEVSGKAFKRPTEFRDHKIMWMKRPHYRREHTRIVIDEGKVVAGVAIVELPVRYGDAILRLGGISAVATDPDAQKRGYGRACMEDAVQYLKRDGFDISFLLGIRNYYHRFGYRTALTWFALRCGPTQFESGMPPGMRVRKARRSDIPSMAALYERTIGRCDLSVVRTREDWEWYFRFGRFADAYVIFDEKGDLAAYLTASVRVRVDELAVVESYDAYEAVLAFLRNRAKESFAGNIEVYTEPEGPFARYCLYKKRIPWHRWTDCEGGPMLRLMDVETVFGKIGGALAERWQNAPRSVAPEAVTLSCPMGQVALVPMEGKLIVKPGEGAGALIELPDECVTELVLGFRPAGDILADAGVRTTDAASGVLDALFPEYIPFLPPTDHM